LTQEVAVAANAVASATAALSSKNAAATSASTATTQATNASTSATNAASSAAAAAASYDSFDDRYLGAKTSDPTVDNDGNALLTGALYWNSATGVFKAWSGSAWVTNITSNQFGTNVATFLQTPTSANLAAALTDKTGTGVAVFASNPTFPAQINLTANSGYNIYASGTANNFLAGKVGVGDVFSDTSAISIGKSITGATTINSVNTYATIQSDVTVTARGYQSQLGTAAASFTLTNLQHFSAVQLSIGAGSSVTTQIGFRADASLTGATNNYGFYGGITAAAGTNRYNLFMEGTADNYLAGSLGVGIAPSAGINLSVNKNLTGATVTYGVDNQYNIQSDVTVGATGFRSVAYTQAASFTLANLVHFDTTQVALGAGSSVTTQIGFRADASLTGATKNYGFFGNIAAAAGTNRYNLFMEGTADNYLAGSLGIGTASPNASAILDVQSTTKGVRMPNMTTTQKNAISSPAAGLMVFDTTLSKLCVYSGAAWQTITSI
jgi:hypothetical protein